MKITVLGYESPFPGPENAGPGFLLEHQDKYILIDVGSEVLSRLQRQIDLNRLDAVFISHLHHDHMSDLLVLQYAMQIQMKMKKRSKPLPVYFPKEPKDIAEIIPYEHFIEPHYIDETSVIQLDDLSIAFLKTDHAVPCYAMKFKSKEKTFIYGADSGTGTIWSPFTDNADLLILECTYLEKDRPAQSMGHLSTIDVVNISKAVQPKQVLISHLFPDYRVNDIKDELINYGVKGELHIPQYGKAVTI